MKKAYILQLILLLSFTLAMQSGCAGTDTPPPTDAPTDAPTAPPVQQTPGERTMLVKISSSSDWMDFRILDDPEIQSAESVNVTGNPTGHNVTEAGISLDQPLADAEDGISVGVSGRYQIAAAEDQIRFSLNKGCIGITSVRISMLDGDSSALLFDYDYQATETTSGCELIEFVLDISGITVGQEDLTSEPIESEYSVEEDSTYIKGAQMFDEDEALQHIEFLASDDLQGRLLGTQESLEAGEYIADFFEENGLQPAGVDVSYFQPFTTTITKPIDQAVLAVTSPGSHTYTTHSEYSPRVGIHVGTGGADGPVIWLGQCRPSDFSGSLAGQIVLCGPQSGVNIREAVSNALHYKLGGLLIFSEDDGPYPRSGYGWGKLINIPAFTISREIIEDLLEGSQYGLADLNQLKAPTTLTVTVSMSSSYEKVEAQGRNVLGLLPGADDALKDEYVIIGAHYDHVGADPDGTVFNGASDNASGTAVVMEIARLWDEQGIRPARSVVFAAWDGEEMGLKGAHYYTDNPIFPLGNTVAFINVDSIGIGDLFYIYGEGAVADQLEDSAAIFSIPVQRRPQALGDDIAFADEGILSGSYMVFLDNGDYYPELHQPEDDTENIQLDLLRTAGILSAYSLYHSSNGN